MTDTDTALAIVPPTLLPAMLERAAGLLAAATSAGALLEAIAAADHAYDEAKRYERMAKAKGAHDEMLSHVHRAQADALDIEARGKRILADEYDSAQERGDVASQGRPKKRLEGETFFEPGDGQRVAEKLLREAFGEPATLKDMPGLTKAVLHESRMIRDAEESDPGIVRRTVDEAVEAGEAPTKAKVKRAVRGAAKRKRKPKPPKVPYVPESEHDRDLRLLLGFWGAACASAQEAFLNIITSPSQEV